MRAPNVQPIIERSMKDYEDRRAKQFGVAGNITTYEFLQTRINYVEMINIPPSSPILFAPPRRASKLPTIKEGVEAKEDVKKEGAQAACGDLFSKCNVM